MKVTVLVYSQPDQNRCYDAGSTNTAGVAASASSSDSNVSTDHHVHSKDSWQVLLSFPWTTVSLMSINLVIYALKG